MSKTQSNTTTRILVLADIQTGDKLTKNEYDKLSKLIDTAKPDMIVLLGDMVQGIPILLERQARQIIQSVVAPIVERKIPFAIVFGNHDSDARVSLERQARIYQSLPCCLTPLPSERKCKEAYTIKLSNLPFQLLFIDSGKTRITPRGIDYYPPSAKTLDYSKKVLNHSQSKTIVFQHVPVPDICQLLKPTETGGIKGKGPFKSQRLILKNPSAGTLGEMPCPSWSNKQQFPAWLESGNVAAAVFAHDHKNSFVGELEGITIIQTAASGLTCYGDDNLRGGRLITLSSDGKLKTKELRYNQLN